MNESAKNAINSRRFADGFTLVEVLIGLAVLAIVSGALVALQVGSLRAVRTAADTMTMAAAAEHQLGLARLIPSLSACRDIEDWPSVSSCEVRSSCLADDCLQRVIEVRLESSAGRLANWRTVVDDALENAPFAGGVAGAEAAGP